MADTIGTTAGDTIIGSGTSDLLRGDLGDDSLSGLAGDDILVGDAGADSLDGGAGFDEARHDGDAAQGGGAGIVARLDLGRIADGFGDEDAVAGIEAVVGTAAADSFTGDGGDNRLTGGDGDDSFMGGDGTDSLDGGLGWDVAFYDAPGLTGGILLSIGSYVGDDGFGNTEHLQSIEEIHGTAFGDAMGASESDPTVVLVGGDGVDTVSGGYWDWVGFAAAGVEHGVRVDLGTGWVFDDGFGNVERVSGVGGVVGTGFDDTLSGGGGRRFAPGAGNDSVAGADNGFDTVSYALGIAQNGIWAKLHDGIVEDGAGGVDTLAGIELVIGTQGGDIFDGGAGDEQFAGLAGADIFDGGSGRDRVRYDEDEAAHGAGGVTVDLAAGLGTDPLGATDSFFSIEEIVGTTFADSVLGSDADETFEGRDGDDSFTGGGGNDSFDGGAGADSFNGGAGDDTFVGGAGDDLFDGSGAGDRDAADYSFDPSDPYGMEGGAGITANLATGVVTHAALGTDTLIGVEVLIATDGSDHLTAAPEGTTFVPRGGSDLIIGGAGRDVVRYDHHSNLPTGDYDVDLAAGVAWNDSGDDFFISIEDVVGSAYDDTLRGDDGANRLDSGGGDGLIEGRGGDDTLVGGYGEGMGSSLSLAGGGGVDRFEIFAPPPDYESAFVEVSDLAPGEILFLAGAEDEDRPIGVTYRQTEDAYNPFAPYVDRYAFVEDGDLTFATLFGDFRGLRWTLTPEAGGVALVFEAATDDTLGPEDGSSLDGGAGDDSLTGGDGVGELIGGRGADTLDGGGARVTVRYDRDAALGGDLGVTVDLAEGTATDGYGDTDVLIDVDHVVGTGFADFLSGGVHGGEWRSFQGLAGNDTLRGVAGYEYLADYRADAAHGGTAGIVVDVGGGWVQDGFGDIDTLIGIDQIEGTAFGDLFYGAEIDSSLYGDAGDDTIYGGDGEEFIRGGAGDDYIDGGAGSDAVSYHVSSATQGVMVDLDANYAIDEVGDRDTLISIENLRGTRFGDTLRGDAGRNQFTGMRGADLIDGGAGHDLARYDRDALFDGGMTGVDVNLTTGVAIDGFGDRDTLVSIERVRGSRFDDSIGGGAFSGDTRQFEGLAGADTLYGDAGSDYAAVYWSDADHGGTAGIVADRTAGTVRDGFGDLDRLIGIYSIEGTDVADAFRGDGAESSFSGRAGDDLVLGGAGDEYFRGGRGADWIDGAGGFDQVAFTDSAGVRGAEADLAAGYAIDEFGDRDSLARIEALRGSRFGDTLRGDAADNMVRGLGGADVIDGRGGVDRVRYDRDARDGGAAAVTVDLDLGTATDGFGARDTLIGVEEVEGTALADSISGDGADNLLLGAAGADTLSGRGGADALEGGAGADLLEGGAGADLFRGAAAELDGDRIADFGLDDRIEIAAALPVSAVSLAAAAGGARLLIDTDGDRAADATIALEDVASDAALDVVSGGGVLTVQLRPDRVAPALTSLAMPATVQLTAGGTAAARFTAAAEDASGVASVTIRFASALRTPGGAVSQIVLSAPAWSTTLALAEETGAGAFAIQSVTLADTLGNAATLDAAALAAGGWPTAFTVLAPAAPPPDDGGSGDPGEEDPGFDDPGSDEPEEIFGTDGDDRIVCGPDGASVDAGAGDDSVTGGAGADTVSAGDGADTVRGQAGDDLVDGDDGDDSLDGGAGSDELYGGAGDDTLAGDDGADTLAGDDGADLLVGGAGNDRLEGDGGSDTLDGGAGDDVAIGGAGVDTIRYLGAAAVALNLSLTGAQRTIGAGADRILSIENAATGSGADRLVGSRGANLLSAGVGDDQLDGGAGADTLLGGDGRDTLDGDAGRDVLTGGGGADRFVFDLAADSTRTVRDRITDFRRGLDRIDLSAIDAAAEPGDQAFRFRGSRSFSGEEGDLRFAAGLLTGDLDGDRVADLAVQLSGVGRLAASDLLL